MTAVQRIAPEIRSIHVPAPLRDLPLWCVWAYEQHPGEPKPRKIPHYSMGGRRFGKQGSPEDLAKLTTFALARDAAVRRGLDGVGFALTKDAGIAALDFDGCVVDGVCNPVVTQLVKNTYAEYSPSGNGVRAFFRGDLGNHKAHDKTDGFSYEVFSSNGFVTVTGNMLPFVDILGHEDTIAKLTPEVEAYCVKRFGTREPTAAASTDPLENFSPKLGLSLDESYDLLQQISPDIGRSDWMRVALALFHEYGDDEDAFQLWNEWSSYGSTYPGEEALRYQWESLSNRSGFKPVTMASVIHMTKQADLRLELNSAKSLKSSAEKFHIYSAEEVGKRPPAKWLIKGMLPEKSLVMLYGRSGSGKSFAALDLAGHVALGRPWNGKKTKAGRVLYIAAEGTGGMAGRLEALRAGLCVEFADLDIGVILAAPNFLNEADISAVLTSIAAHGSVDLIVVDTLAQVTPGADENSSDGMGMAITNAQRIIREAEATVLLVHHSGKDEARGARGWSGLRAAVDAEFEVKSHGVLKEIKVTKMKEGEEGQVFAFQLIPLNVGTDEDGEIVSSCSLRYVDAVPQAAERRRTGGLQHLALDALLEGEGMTEKDLIDRMVEQQPVKSGKKDNRIGNARRAIQSLVARGMFRLDGDLIFRGGC